MKFFGWGRKKDPPPIQPALIRQEFKLQYSDVVGAAEHGSVHTQQEDSKPQSTRVYSAKESSEDPALVDHLDTWEERLQETIRFVFSHEQEGLLAIGTFALDQLAGVTLTDHKPPPPAVTDHRCTPRRTSFSSSTSTTVQSLIREVRSSDDENDSFGSPITKPESDYPVFGDPGSIITARSSTQPPSCKSPLAEIKATRSPSAASPSMKHVHDQFELDQEFNSPGLCGLFPSRSRRLQRDGVKRKKPPEKMKKVPESRTKGTSLGAHLGRLWRSGCSTGASESARVTPEMNPGSSPPEAPPVDPSQTQGLSCIANADELAAEGGEQRKRRGHSFGKAWASCAHNGNWIRTDSECKLAHVPSLFPHRESGQVAWLTGVLYKVRQRYHKS